ncbi:MAG: proton-conducting transporter membrane subunit [Bacillota bacterium]
MQSWLPWVTVILPAVSAAVLGSLKEEQKALRNAISLGTALVTAGIVLFLMPAVIQDGVVRTAPLLVTPAFSIELRVDHLGMMFALIASGLWVFAMLYSIGYMAHENGQRTYFTFFTLSLGVTMGIAFAANLFILYFFYEFLTLTTYPLVIHYRTKEAMVAGAKYIVYSLCGATLILAGIVLTYTWTGSVAFSELSILGGAPRLAVLSTTALALAFALYIAGFGVKAAIMPLHSWLPSAMVAPTPVSALLHAVAVVKAGVFGVLRTMYSVFGDEVMHEMAVSPYFVAVLLATILAGSVFALNQDVLKRRLAYSTVSQLGYIMLGAALLTPMGFKGGMLHMFNHSLMKITLFFCAGLIAEGTGKTRVSELAGIGRSMPLTMTAFALASIGMIGALPMNGFWSKWFLINGSVESGMSAAVVVLAVSALLNAAYFLPISISAFFHKPAGVQLQAHGPGHGHHQGLGEGHPAMLWPTLALACLCLVLGFWPDLPVALVSLVVQAFLG